MGGGGIIPPCGTAAWAGEGGNFWRGGFPLADETRDGLNFGFGHAVSPGGHGSARHAVGDDLLNGLICFINEEGLDIERGGARRALTFGSVAAGAIGGKELTTKRDGFVGGGNGYVGSGDGAERHFLPALNERDERGNFFGGESIAPACHERARVAEGKGAGEFFGGFGAGVFIIEGGGNAGAESVCAVAGDTIGSEELHCSLQGCAVGQCADLCKQGGVGFGGEGYERSQTEVDHAVACFCPVAVLNEQDEFVDLIITERAAIEE